MYKVMKRLEVPKRLRNDMKYIIAEGIFAGTFITITGAMFGSVFLIAFARKIGMNSFHIAILAASPQLANMAQFVASFIIENYIPRKKFFIYTALIARILWIIAVFIPTIIGKNLPGLTIWSFIFTIAIANLFAYFAGTAWLSWMKDIIPNKYRGKFFSRRNLYTNTITMILPYIVGRVFDKYNTILSYANVFTLATIIGIIGVFIISKVKDKMEPVEEKIKFAEILKLPFRNKNFIYFLLFSIFFTLGTVGMLPFLQIYLLEDLNFPKATIGFFLLVSGTLNVVSNIFWGEFSAKYGHRNTLVLAGCGASLFPFLWVVTNKSNGFVLSIFIHFLGGIAWAGMILAHLNLLFTISPKKRNSAYMASFSFVNGATGVIAPLLGVFIIKMFENITFPAVKILFIVSGIFRIIAVMYLIKVKEIKAVPLRLREFFKPRYYS